MGLGNMERFNFSKTLRLRNTHIIEANDKMIDDLRSFIIDRVSDNIKISFEMEIQNRIQSFEKTLRYHLLTHGGNLNSMSYYNLDCPFSRELDVYRKLTLFVDENTASCSSSSVDNITSLNNIIYKHKDRFREDASYTFQKVLQVRDYLSKDSEIYKIISEFVHDKISCINEYFDDPTNDNINCLKYKLLFNYFLDNSFCFSAAIKSKEYSGINNFVRNFGLQYSEDEEFYIYLLNQIKRSDGYQERKYDVLSRAVSNGIVSNKIAESIDKLTKKYRWQICCDIKEFDYKIDRKKSYLESKGIYESIKKYYSSVCAKIIANSSSEIQPSKLADCLNISDKIFTLPILTKHLSSWYLNKLKEEIENARK